MPIRCIDHQINLITTDICKLTFAQDLLKKCMKVVRFFKASHKAEEILRAKILEKMVKGKGLKSYVKMCWSTAFNCANSVLSYEIILKSVSTKYCTNFTLFSKLIIFIYYNEQIATQDANTLNGDIKKIISNQHFYVDLEELVSIIEPIKKALKCLEFKSTTLANCFIEIIKLYAAIKDLPETYQVSFCKKCIKIFNRR